MAGLRENRLARETSPYLLQHSRNPVDWRAWGQEAIAEARRLERPILLSIGYSTCYWCHVMERECFEDEALAVSVNASFIPIKVDREERPDLDEAYMAATQLVTGCGGWPMTAFVEPAGLRPFWCGTYLPPEPRGGMPGFGQVLEAIAEAWRERRADVLAQAERIGHAVAEHMSRPTPASIGVPQIERAVAGVLSIHDRVNGGFGREPKFPQPTILGFLLDVRAGADAGTRAAIDEAARSTLEAMAKGGIRDHVGGGFHRYAVDARWEVPHFEKMLNDNAALAELYARAGVVYADGWLKAAAIETCEFIVAKMGNPGGGFAAAIDAEVDGREGVGYVWTRERVMEALGGEDGPFACTVYGLDAGPNFRDPHHPDEPPASVLVLSDRHERAAARLGIRPEEFERRRSRVNQGLRASRESGPTPRIDRTTIAAWNGKAIWALARCGALLDRPGFIDAAIGAAGFVLDRMRGPCGELRRTHRVGVEEVEGFLEDHAWIARGLLSLHSSTREARWLDAARSILARAEDRFGDKDGGYHDAPESAELFVRPRSASDGAAESASAAMLHALLDAFDATGERAWVERAASGLRSLSPEISAAPAACASAVAALFRMHVADGERASRLEEGATAPVPEPSGGEFTPVQVFAGVDRLIVGRDEPAVFELVLRIAPGHHIAAADPGVPGLSPLRVGLIGGGGVRVFAEYPPGAPWATDPAVLVHEGTVEFKVVVERDGEWSGRPLLTVSFQACTERECLPASVVELDIALDPA